MKPPRWPHFVLSCRVDLFRARFQLEMWAASARAFAENSLSQLWDSVPSSKIFLLWLWKTVHCGPHAPPLSRSFKRPLCMSFWKMCNIRQQGFPTLCEFTIRGVLQNLSSHWNVSVCRDQRSLGCGWFSVRDAAPLPPGATATPGMCSSKPASPRADAQG